MRPVYRGHGAASASPGEATSEGSSAGKVSQVYLLGEIVAAFNATGRSMVIVDCSRCPRRGRLSLRRLLTEHGPQMRGPDLLNAIAADCDKQGTQSTHDVCGARFPEMVEVFLRPTRPPSS
jgi:hypothetical protein